MKKIIFSLLTLSLLFVGCDKIDNPIQQTQQNNNNTNDSTTIRRVLIEEFTGQLCTFCPDGAREIERLDSVYANQIIPVSIHAGGFAEPGNGAPNDFTTAEGDDYYTTFGVVSNPAATVSRLNNAAIIGKSQWEAQVISIKDDEALAEVTITNTYNTSNRNVNVDVKIDWLKDGGTANYKLQIYVIEDHITAGQLDNGNWIANYDHRHMFRAAVNGNWGTNLTLGSSLGTNETQQFSYTLDASWKEDDCEIVAFIYKEGPDYEVIQANIKHVK